MNPHKSGASFLGTGLLTILTVLLVLVLSVFSILTYISAKADLSLSRINAAAVSAYYTADTEAVRMVQAFSLGREPELLAEVPMTDRQSLSIHAVRDGDSTVEILSWNVVNVAAIPD